MAIGSSRRLIRIGDWDLVGKKYSGRVTEPQLRKKEPGARSKKPGGGCRAQVSTLRCRLPAPGFWARLPASSPAFSLPSRACLRKMSATDEVLMGGEKLLSQNLTEFFRELVQSAMTSQAVRSSEETEFYLVTLL